MPACCVWHSRSYPKTNTSNSNGTVLNDVSIHFSGGAPILNKNGEKLALTLIHERTSISVITKNHLSWRGPYVLRSVVTNLATYMRIIHLVTYSQHPQVNGADEKWNRMLAHYIMRLTLLELPTGISTFCSLTIATLRGFATLSAWLRSERRSV